VGVGTPGSLSRATGLLRGSNSVCLNGRPIRRDLEALLERDVRITNDANCFALSEATDGAGQGAAVVHGVIVGTGVGSGIVVHGRVLDGPMRLRANGDTIRSRGRGRGASRPACYCGRRGCIETWLSGPAIERDHCDASGERRHAEDIAAAAAAGDRNCEATLARYEERFARGIAHVINVLDPDVIVLGGGMSNIERLYANVPKHWAPWIFSDRVDTKLVRNVHGDSSGVRGAAWLWGRAPR
jgi:predicted NBD/HSP70 family sugar kinase